MPQGSHVEGMTPGQHPKHSLAGALDPATGTLFHGLGARPTTALCRDLRAVLEAWSPAEPYIRIDVVGDHDKSHQANAVEPWLAAHPRVTWRLWPTDGPRANPIARAFGEVQDGCTRHHRRQRVPALVAEVEDHLHRNGPWPSKLSDLYEEPALTAAVENIAAEEYATVAA
jgi:hypothetical protein